MAHTNALVVGSGGREAMIASLLAKDSMNVFVAPGNGGTHEYALPVAAVPDLPDCTGFLEELQRLSIGIVVTGSENDLVAGVADRIREQDGRRIHVLGASQAAAHFEGSKIFARRFMEERFIPHPQFTVFESPDLEANIDAATQYVERALSGVEGLVLKADGLCGGKGVVVFHDMPEFTEGVALLRQMTEKGVAGARQFLIEKMIKGPEVSVTAIVGENGNYVLLPCAQDYKRVGEGDTGPNTGSMGAVTVDLPRPLMDAIRKIIEPTIKGAREIGRPMERCVLYAGLMLREEDGEPIVLEYNMRFGDPETQVILPRVQNIATLITDAARGMLAGDFASIRPEHFATVVMAAKGYPGDYKDSEKKPIFGVGDEYPNAMVLVSGTSFDPHHGTYAVKGSRNLNVIGWGPTQQEALAHAYDAVGRIESDGLFYRRDIGCNLDKLTVCAEKFRAR